MELLAAVLAYFTIAGMRTKDLDVVKIIVLKRYSICAIHFLIHDSKYLYTKLISNFKEIVK